MKMTPEQELERLHKVASELGEHYDCVHVFVSRCESGEHHGTFRLEVGVGNWFARYGQIREWLLREEETSRCHARKDNSGDKESE